MGLSDEHAGIMDLPADTPVGIPFAALLGLDDPVIEIAVTPNRPDCLGVRGVARDLAAAGLGRLKESRTAPVPGRFACPVGVEIAPEVRTMCPAFAGRVVRGVRNGASPDWLQRRLRAIGLRPINALVDITNYLTFDAARPLHVFDAGRVEGDLTVRPGRAGESLTALDGRTYAVDESICVIADARGVESLAGIMGGEATGCTEATTEVFIESALWDPALVARTGRRLAIHSDARHRFERGVDPAYAVEGLERATAMVLEICGGEASEIVLAGAVPEERRVIAFPVAEVRRLTGLEVGEEEIAAVLSRLGFALAGEPSRPSVTVPSWRPDISGKADLVEEVMRIVGVDRVPSTPMAKSIEVPRPVLTAPQVRRARARRLLAGRGMVEAVTWSFIAEAPARAFGGGAAELALANPIAADLAHMRPSLLPGLVAAAQRNADRGYPDAALFEVGQIFRGDRPEDQLTAAAGVRRGTARPTGAGRHWSGAAGGVDAFDAKADALALLAELGVPADRVQVAREAPGTFHPGRSGALKLGPKTVLGVFGELHPAVLDELGASGPLAAFELVLDAVPAPKARPTRTRPPLELAALQPVRRDFAFVVEESVGAEAVMRAARAADKALVSEVSVFDVFRGGALEPGRKSVAIEVVLQPTEKTLTDQEIEAVSARIVGSVEAATRGSLRT